MADQNKQQSYSMRQNVAEFLAPSGHVHLNPNGQQLAALYVEPARSQQKSQTSNTSDTRSTASRNMKPAAAQCGLKVCPESRRPMRLRLFATPRAPASLKPPAHAKLNQVTLVPKVIELQTCLGPARSSIALQLASCLTTSGLGTCSQ